MSSDFKTLSLTIAQGIKAHDPQYGEFKAEDLAWIINVYVPSTPEMPESTLWKDETLAARVLGEYTLEIFRNDGGNLSLKLLNAELSRFILAGPLRKQFESLGRDAAAKEAVGTGPFRLVNEQANLRVFERVPDHWRFDPAMDQLVYLHVVESGTRLALVQAGEADLAMNLSEFEANRAVNDGLTAIEVPNARIFRMAFGGTADHPDYDPNRARTAPWIQRPDDPAANERAFKVRQAFAMAIDVDTMLQQLHFGLGSRLSTYVPGASSPEFAPYAYDPARAKTLLEEANYPFDYEVTVLCNFSRGSPRARPEMEAVSNYLRIIGVKVINDCPDGGSVFYPLWNTGVQDGIIWSHRTGGAPGSYLTKWSQCGGGIFCDYTDDEIIRLAKEMGKVESTDQQEYDRLEREAHKRIYDNYYVIPLYITHNAHVVGKDFVSWDPTGYTQQSTRFENLVFKP